MPSPPAQLGSLKIPNQQEGIALHQAFQKPFLPSAMGRAQGPDLDFSHPDGRPSSRPHAGRQVWPKLHYGYLITSPSQQESNPTEHLPFFYIFILGENSVHAASEWMLAALQAQSSLKLPWFTGGFRLPAPGRHSNQLSHKQIAYNLILMCSLVVAHFRHNCERNTKL